MQATEDDIAEMRKFKPILLRLVPPRLLQMLVIDEERHPILNTPCVIYCGNRHSRNGYGRFHSKIRKKESQAHIVVWESIYGPVHVGLLLDHLCRVRCCVAPWHLEPVSHKENTLRGDAILFSKGGKRIDFRQRDKQRI